MSQALTRKGVGSDERRFVEADFGEIFRYPYTKTPDGVLKLKILFFATRHSNDQK